MTMPPLRHLIAGLLLAALLCCALAPRPLMAGPHTVPLIIGDTLNEQGKPKPLSPYKRKLLEAVERELGVVFELRMYPWARAERYALDGAGLIFGLPKNADRLHALRYSDVAAYNKLWIVTRSDATFRFNSIEDLRGKSIGVVRGYNYGEEVERARASKLFRTDEDIASRGTRLTRLMLKRVDACYCSNPASKPRMTSRSRSTPSWRRACAPSAPPPTPATACCPSHSRSTMVSFSPLPAPRMTASSIASTPRWPGSSSARRIKF